ncbi:MAG: allantoinase [Benniella sp.]|nr:MAG: allantoinase [Benniella sp.]
MSRLVITSNRVLRSPAAPAAPGTIIVDKTSGTIVQVLDTVQSRQDFSEADEVVEAGDNVVMPGVVDAHVHINEPGRTDWEGFTTATKAAAAGGVTTLIDMPLNSIPPTTTVSNLHEKLNAAREKISVDVGFYGGVIPSNLNDLIPLVKEGVKGFKCFMIESGVDEFPCVNKQQIEDAMKKFQELQREGKDTVFMFHAEMDCGDVPKPDGMDPKAYNTFLHQRPQVLETNAIRTIIEVAKEHPEVRCHIVHLSASDALPMIRQAKAEGVQLTVETCPHYLSLNSEIVPEGATEYKCCPPIREDENRDKLWEALKEGTIDYVVSDHSPCVVELKLMDEGDFLGAWGGIGGLQFGIPVVWTEARRRGCTIQDLTKWQSFNTARQVGLGDTKGSIKEGADADFVIWNPDETFVVTEDIIEFKNKVTPYMGRTLHGVVKETFVRGKKVWSQGNFTTETPVGKLLL